MSSRTSGAGRSVVVTGAGKGLGAAFATAFAATGAGVLVNNRHGGSGLASAEVIAAGLVAKGGRAVANTDAVDAPGAAEAIVGAAVSAFGHLDTLILNAGITGPIAKVGQLGEADLRTVMEINFFANAALVTAALPHLRAAAAARIVFIASTAGLHGLKGRPAYAASKGALIGYALSLADELRRDAIGVNVLAPYAATPMTAGSPVDADPRMDPRHAAPAALWLASPACTATGEIWVAGAGRFRRAQTLESRGVGMFDASPEWLGAHAGEIADMAGARSYSGGEKAFADLFADSEEPICRV
jgi:NAD(P)-dependent dehydrogenase (short-subunit alcohol dehydrogenase family)